jgi:choline dehydrogenase-like flavoprotein
MTVLRAQDIAADDTLDAEICVVGSGAAGLTLARRLDGTGRRVIVLEAGGFEHDETAEVDSFEIEHAGTPYRNPIASRGRWFGGSTNLWFGRIATPQAIDLAHRPWVPHSGWPFTIEALDPWIEVAAQVLAVPQHDKLAIERWSPNPTIETFAGDGRTDLGVFLWSDDMYMARAGRPALERSSDVVLVTDATVTGLVSDASSVTAATVVGPGGRRFRVSASRFVLAAGGLENPRLMLASTGSQPAGIGNQHDNVGRYYLDHPRGEGLARVDLRGLSDTQVERLAMLDERVDSPYGKTQLRVVFTEQLQRSEQLLNHALHGYLVADVHRSPGFESYKRVAERVRRRHVEDRRALVTDLATIVRSTPQLLGLGIKRARGQLRPTEFVVVDQMEHEPDPDSRVTVIPRSTDRYGLPRLRVDWRIGASTRRSQHRMHELFRDALIRAGITTFRSDVLDQPDAELELWDMKHPSGTTRMSASPRTGVVDADGRVHGVDNLYVAGSSVFPTSGHFNPTLVIVALAARLADHLAGRR